MELVLREHQSAVIDALRNGFREGHKSLLLYAPTGFGKTEVAISLMKATSDNYKKASMVLDRIVLIDQTSLRLSKYNISHGVFQANHWKYDVRERLQVCSAQTLERRDNFPKPDLLIIDECFTGDTLISTPMGDKKISLVRCGDTVYNSLGAGTVLGVKASPADELYKLEFEDGSIIECTGNHPFFTDVGWVKAREMEIGRVSFSEQGLRLLWENILSKKNDREREGSGNDELGKLKKKAKSLLNILLSEAERDKAQTYKAWRERATFTLASAGASSCIRGGMGIRGIGSDKDGTLQWDISKSLRWLSWIFGKKITGCEKNRHSYFPRLVNISCIKREGITTVFNLHISGHPSYFANGKLVHNCHIARKQTTEFIKKNPDIKVIGLTATPFTKGLGDIYSKVICGMTTGDLVERKWLAPLKVFIAKEIDMTGAKKVAGEWSQEETTKRGMQITGDIVGEWINKTHEIFGRPRKTIVFCSGVAHGTDLVAQFAARGYNFVSISYKDDDEFKRSAIEDFAKPDTEIHGLIATDVLTRGFDVPDVMIGVSARPFSKSLSSHIQQLGRVMRPNPDKEFALWLDHSGNYIRFLDDWDEVYANGVEELSDVREKAKKEPTKNKKEASKCPVCHALWPKHSNTCSSCGHVRKRRNEISSVNGEMVELSENTKNVKEEKQDFYSELQYIALSKSYNSHWADHKYREKFGVWPKGLNSEPKHPSVKTINWIKHKHIAFVKGRNKGLSA